MTMTAQDVSTFSYEGCEIVDTFAGMFPPLRCLPHNSLFCQSNECVFLTSVLSLNA